MWYTCIACNITGMSCDLSEQQMHTPLPLLGLLISSTSVKMRRCPRALGLVGHSLVVSHLLSVSHLRRMQKMIMWSLPIISSIIQVQAFGTLKKHQKSQERASGERMRGRIEGDKKMAQ